MIIIMPCEYEIKKKNVVVEMVQLCEIDENTNVW